MANILKNVDKIITSSGTEVDLENIQASQEIPVEYLVVAGGGGGGTGFSGGGSGGSGGAGGYLTNFEGDAVLFQKGASIQLSVGVGGSGATYNGAVNRRGGRGTNSVLDTIEAWGGGAGGGQDSVGTTGNPSATPSLNTLDGGSGGGAGGYGGGNTRPGGVGNWPVTDPAQGTDGGSSYGMSASGDGGGLAASNSITGTVITYATGGVRNAAHGAANTGNGGGANTGSGTGGNGGSGVVIISYPDTFPDLISIDPSHVLRKADGSLGSSGELVAPLTGRAGYKAYVFTNGSGSISW